MKGLNEIKRLNRRACVHCAKERFVDRRIESRDECYKCNAIADPENYGSRWSFARHIEEAGKELSA